MWEVFVREFKQNCVAPERKWTQATDMTVSVIGLWGAGFDPPWTDWLCSQAQKEIEHHDGVELWHQYYISR
jgi:hypothetical protein